MHYLSGRVNLTNVYGASERFLAPVYGAKAGSLPFLFLSDPAVDSRNGTCVVASKT